MSRVVRPSEEQSERRERGKKEKKERRDKDLSSSPRTPREGSRERTGSGAGASGSSPSTAGSGRSAGHRSASSHHHARSSPSVSGSSSASRSRTATESARRPAEDEADEVRRLRESLDEKRRAVRELERAAKEDAALEARLRAQLREERRERALLEEKLEAATARIEGLTEKLRRARDVIASQADAGADERVRAQLGEQQRRVEELAKETADWRERAAAAEESGGAVLGRALAAEQQGRELAEHVRALKREVAALQSQLQQQGPAPPPRAPQATAADTAGAAAGTGTGGTRSPAGTAASDKPLPPLPPASAPAPTIGSARAPSASSSPSLDQPEPGSSRSQSEDEAEAEGRDDEKEEGSEGSGREARGPLGGAELEAGVKRVLDQAPDYAAEQGSAPRGPAAQRLLRLVLGGHAVLDAALLAVAPADVDRLVRAATALHAAAEPERGRALFALLRHALAAEVDATPVSAYATLFRANSPATKLAVAYVRRVGLPWLRAALLPPLEALCRAPPPVEIDPFKLSSSSSSPSSPTGTSTVQRNAANLRTLTRSFLDAIYRATRDAPPPELGALAAVLRRRVERKFPGRGVSAVGGLVFLRVLCPALIAPDSWGLLPAERVPAEARRALILVSKVVQATSNEVEPGRKEDYMLCMNDFMREQQAGLAAFLAALSAPPEAPPAPPTRLELAPGDVRQALAELHALLAGAERKTAAALDREAEADALGACLRDLGPPPAAAALARP